MIKLTTQFYILPLVVAWPSREKDRRQLNNIIVDNMVQYDDEDPSARKAGDINKATSLFKECLKVKPTVINAVRIGKKPPNHDGLS